MPQTLAKNWKSRIQIQIAEYTDEQGSRKDPITIFPFNSVNVNFSKSATVMDSVDNSNVGFVFGNRRYTFAVEVFPVRSGANTSADSDQSPLYYLNRLALESKIFDVIITPVKRDITYESPQDQAADDSWAYSGVTVSNCMFTTGGLGSYDTTAGLKIIRFDGLALKLITKGVNGIRIYS